jgi:hypothetical protein
MGSKLGMRTMKDSVLEVLGQGIISEATARSVLMTSTSEEEGHDAIHASAAAGQTASAASAAHNRQPRHYQAGEGGFLNGRSRHSGTAGTLR